MSAHPIESKALTIALWIVQVLLAVFFVYAGLFKLITSISQLAAMWPWAGETPTLVRLTGLIDLLGGLGILLPSLTRIKPQVTVLAALGCALLMVSAIVFHLARGEGANTPFNFVVLALSLFVYWGRRSKAPIM